MMLKSRLKILWIFSLIVLLFSSSGFARTVSQPETLVTIKLYSEPKDRDLKLFYRVTLPKNHYYSYYLGSDLPTWRFVNNRIVEGAFHSVELVNIRVHSDKKEKNKTCDTIQLILKDPTEKRIVWQGEIIYGCQNKKVSVVTTIDNQNYYKTDVKLDSREKTVLIETEER